MIAAAVTLWLTFALWISADHIGLSRQLARTAGTILVIELVALMVSSYGCDGVECTALADAVGSVARTDIPVLAVLCAVAAVIRARVARPRP